LSQFKKVHAKCKYGCPELGGSLMNLEWPRSFTSKDGRTRKTFDALDWSRRREVPFAHLVTHVPGRYEQMVRYYGYYSNKTRGLRKKAETDDNISAIVKNEMSSQEWRQNWARLIQKVYEVDPLICPKCQGEMRIIAFIEDEPLIKKILMHHGTYNMLRRSQLDNIPKSWHIICLKKQVPIDYKRFPGK
jgi:hypothetical protein